MKKNILVTTEHPAPYMDELFSNLSIKYNVSVIYINKKSDEKEWNLFSTNFPGDSAIKVKTVNLSKKIRRSDIVIVGGWFRFFHIKTILISLFMNKKLAFFSDAPNILYKKIWIRMLQSLILRFIPIYFVAGGEAGRLFAKTYWIKDTKKIKSFPYQSWIPDSDIVSIYNERRINCLNARNGKIKLFIANRFIERKGYSDIVKALNFLKNRHLLEFFHIDIAGNGPEFEYYRSLFQQNFPGVILHGWIETEKYRELMLSCDIFIHASRFEPYGIPVIDACNCKKSVIATSGVCAAVDAKSSGYPVQLYPSGDGLELGVLLEQLFIHRDVIYDIAESPDFTKSMAPLRNIASIDEVFDPPPRTN